MSFFDSEMVRAEMAEVSELQEEVYANVVKFYSMSPEDQEHHILQLEKLINKQKILYTRISLSDDPDAKRMKEEIQRSATLMGLPNNVDMNFMFNEMSKMIDIMKAQFDKR
tara:strand:+ start:2676 stop:3008 length:333 start_codon:yes stop_codon:yes gene_type:complete